MASKTFEEILNSRPAEEKKQLAQVKSTVLEAAKVEEPQKAVTITNKTANATPVTPTREGSVNNTATSTTLDSASTTAPATKQAGKTLESSGVQTAAPTTATPPKPQGNSSTFNETAAKPTTATTPTTDTNKPKQTL